MMKEEIVVGCDIGTGSCKAIAFTTDGTFITESHQYYNVQYREGGLAEQDPEMLIDAFCKCLKSLVKQLPAQPIAIGLSSCMHSLVLLDAHQKPLTPLITWEDTRSHHISELLRNSDHGKKLYLLTGTPIHSMSPLCKIAWFRKNEKQLFNRTAKFIGIKEYLWYRMFGVFEIDHSVASATGLFNIRNYKWEKTALQYCGIQPAQLSEPVSTLFTRTQLSNSFKKLTGLNDGITVCIGASDGCMANAGSNITRGSAALTIGTSAAVRISAPKPVTDFRSMIFNYILDKKTIVSGGPSNNGGNVMKWFFRELLSNDHPSGEDFAGIEKGTTSIPPGCEGLICLPYFSGERAPVWDEKATAAILGIRSIHTKYHIIKAAQEGIAFTMREILESLERKSSPINTLIASGGFIHSRDWVQIMADITEKKIIVREQYDASSTGAAIWAMRALRKTFSVNNASGEKEIINPRKEYREMYQAHYAIFKKLYATTKQQMHLLNP